MESIASVGFVAALLALWVLSMSLMNRPVRVPYHRNQMKMILEARRAHREYGREPVECFRRAV